MPRRVLGIAIAGALLFQAQARADAAQQAIGGIGAFLLPALCAFITTGLEETEEEHVEAGEGVAESEEQVAARADRTGWHLGAAGSVQVEDFENLGARSADDSLGMKLRLGYRCSPHLGWEFDYEWAESFDVSDGSDVDLWALMSNAKWYPLTGRVQPFLVAGVGIVTADPETVGRGTDIGLRFGTGIDVYLTGNWALTLDGSYVVPTAKVKDRRYVSVGWGLLYRF